MYHMRKIGSFQTGVENAFSYRINYKVNGESHLQAAWGN